MINSLKDEENKINKKGVFLGIEILRAILAFFIVVRHFFKLDYEENYFTKFVFHCQPFYVPTFFLISFYFSFETFYSKNIKKINERFKRILIPYLSWPIILWIRNIIIDCNMKLSGNALKDIVIQLLIGYGFYGVFWFQFNLIFLSIIFLIIIFIFKKYSLFIFNFSCIFLLIINDNYQLHLKDYKKIYPIKRLLPCFIYSFTGFYFGSISIINQLSEKRKPTFLLIIPAAILINQYNQLAQISLNFQILTIELTAICIFLVFSLIPLESIGNSIYKKLIKAITSYTGGIYYIHYGVRNIFSTRFKIIGSGNLEACIINYMLCYFICFIGTSIFKNTKLRYLFN